MSNRQGIHSTASEQTTQDAYIAYYGRPADPGGLTYWASRLDDANGNLNAVIDAFGNSAEFTDRFGDLNTTELINAVYQRLFKRDVDDEGLAFYSDLLDSGERSLDTIALDILNGSQGHDLTLLNEKRDVAEAFTHVVALGDLPYDGERGIAVGTGAMGVIGSSWTDYKRGDAEYSASLGIRSFEDTYIQPYYMANQFASQLDGDPTHTRIDRLVDVGRKSQDNLYLPWAGELVIEGIFDARLSPDGSEYDIDRYRIVDLPAGSYDIALTIDGDDSESSFRISANRHDVKQYSENDLSIGYKAHHEDGPNFHQQLQFEDDTTLNIQISGPTGTGTYTLAITPSDTDYPVWDPDWQFNPDMHTAELYDFYDYLFV